MIEHESSTNGTNDSAIDARPADSASTTSTASAIEDVTGDAVLPHTPETHAARLRDQGIELCPWCDGTGQYRTAWTERVPCTPCEGSGEADRWQGLAAEDWRRRKLAAAHGRDGAA